jgi:lysophospholipase L1-like esterase
MTRYHEGMDPNVPSGAAIFIGDSITQGLCVSAVFNPSANYGIGNDTTLGVLKRLTKYESLKRASIAILEVGVNDLRFRKDEEILSNYSSILQLLPAHLTVVVSAILPVNEGIDHKLRGYNARIGELNSTLKVLCESQKSRCTYVDPGQALIDSSGSLSTNYQEGDGLHLNGEGYGVWIQELKKGIKAAQQRRAPDRQETAPAPR